MNYLSRAATQTLIRFIAYPVFIYKCMKYCFLTFDTILPIQVKVLTHFAKADLLNDLQMTQPITTPINTGVGVIYNKDSGQLLQKYYTLVSRSMPTELLLMANLALLFSLVKISSSKSLLLICTQQSWIMFKNTGDETCRSLFTRWTQTVKFVLHIHN